jgi:hypothetical protein
MDELKILYWNTYKKSLDEEIKELVIKHEINFLILLENTTDNDFLINLLKNINPDFKLVNSLVFKKAKVFSSIKSLDIREIVGHGRYGIYELASSNFEKYLLTITHFPSKKDWGNPNDHFGLCVELRTDIELAEVKNDTQNTIIVGDFNMNPFEDGLVNSSGLHNVNNKEIALTQQRNFQGKAYRFFYNPMWSFLGDSSKGKVQGSHFFNTYKPLNYYWNLYDQVMIRPDLIPFFDEKKLDILNKIGEKSLLKKINGYNRINKEISDHLPLIFEIKLKNKEIYEELMA